MSTATAHLLQEFEKLPVDAQREFSDAILRRTAHFEYDAPSDDELIAAAGEIFAMLDREEDADAASSEVWMVDLGMAQKTRPALILSIGYSDDDRALVTVVSHTTSVRGSAFEITLNPAMERRNYAEASRVQRIPIAPQ